MAQHKGKHLVSVIVPVFNAEQFIHETVMSVLEQTYRNIELILVDDSSTDQTYSIIQQFAEIDDRVRCYQMLKNTGGPAEPRNKGLDLARGKFIAFLDDDDLWLKDKLEIQLSEMARLGLRFSSTKAILISEKAGAGAYDVGGRDSGSALTNLDFKTLIRKNVIITSSVVCERDIVGNNRFSNKARHVAVEDYIFWLSLHQNRSNDSAILPRKLICYRVRARSISRNKWVMASKIWCVLGEVTWNGNSLGIKRWIYFLHYIFSSLRKTTYR